MCVLDDNHIEKDTVKNPGIAFNLCYSFPLFLNSPLGNNPLFRKSGSTWSHPVMAPNPIDYKVWANVDSTKGQRGRGT